MKQFSKPKNPISSLKSFERLPSKTFLRAQENPSILREVSKGERQDGYKNRYDDFDAKTDFEILTEAKILQTRITKRRKLNLSFTKNEVKAYLNQIRSKIHFCLICGEAVKREVYRFNSIDEEFRPIPKTQLRRNHKDFPSFEQSGERTGYKSTYKHKRFQPIHEQNGIKVKLSSKITYRPNVTETEYYLDVKACFILVRSECEATSILDAVLISEIIENPNLKTKIVELKPHRIKAEKLCQCKNKRRSLASSL